MRCVSDSALDKWSLEFCKAECEHLGIDVKPEVWLNCHSRKFHSIARRALSMDAQGAMVDVAYQLVDSWQGYGSRELCVRYYGQNSAYWDKMAGLAIGLKRAKTFG